MKAGPLSDCNVQGNPKWGIMSLIKWVDTMSDDLSEVEKASTHPENVSTKVNKYLSFFMSWHMGKINLPVFPWDGAQELMNREERGRFQATLEGNLGAGGALLGNIFYERREGRLEESGLKKVEKWLSANMKGFVNGP
jgi:hypothetical protein